MKQSLDSKAACLEGDGWVLTSGLVVNVGGERSHNAVLQLDAEVTLIQLFANETEALQRGHFDQYLVMICIGAQVANQVGPLTAGNLNSSDSRD